ncbi:MAG: hypothetical protein ACLFS9_11465 [Nitriliruptoraceae bacterium]
MAARILVLCHANVARSPLLAARLRLEVAARELQGAVEVTSAGLDTIWGLPAATGSQVVAERWGASLATHHSRPLDASEAAGSDLVLTMEQRHSRSVLRTVPALEDRVFTAPELGSILADPRVRDRLAAAVAGAEDVTGRLRAVVALAHAHRPGRWQQRRGALEVADPIRQGQPTYDRLGERFTALAAQLATALLGPVPGEGEDDAATS